MNHVKEVQILEGGNIKITLRDRHDVDEYMMELINQEEHALTCMRKKRSATNFLYDASHLISLTSFCERWIFQHDTLLPFLIQLFETLDYLEGKYPYVLQCDMIFLDTTLNRMKGIILPIHEHENMDNDRSQFLHDILTKLQIEDDAILGWFYRLIRQSQVDFKELLAACKKRNHVSLWEKGYRYLVRKQSQKWEQENILRVQQYLQKCAFFCQDERITATNAKPLSSHQDTAVLFPSTKRATLTLDGVKQEIPMNCKIGRSETCDYVVTSSAISSQHAIIECIGNTWYIQDMHSSNGTKLQDKRLENDTPYALANGDWLDIANTRIQFHEYEDKNMPI